MTHVLHIIASPNGSASVSGRLASVFLDELVRVDPSAKISTLSLFDTELPEFGRAAAEAKFAPLLGKQVTREQSEVWQPILECIRQFDQADKIVVSTPMWNGSIPYKLKHYLDVIVQPGISFGYNFDTMQHLGLLKNRPLQLMFSRSSVLLGDLSDFQMPYLRYVFDLIGIRDLRVLAACQTTRRTAEEREAYITSFYQEARDAAARF